ncbi:PH domain-containing protein [Corynebacterium pyruviciproducens]|uniref:PH domain-containing protein n=1 Tax=Corynebacterium pyruviciproducens TaxID=598660 RepID=UPI0023F28AAC|nr:PH domain-containing protein [Corynebacterium pyruviciproducens]
MSGSIEWCRVHRLTPFLHFWTAIFAILAVTLVNVSDELVGAAGDIVHESGPYLRYIGIGAGVTVVSCLVLWALSMLWWRALGFRFTPDEVQTKHGIIHTQVRSARYDRIQAVDIKESVVARVFGLAAVNVEVAGGVGSSLRIEFLKRSEAEAVRAEVLRLRDSSSLPSLVDDRGDVIIPTIPVSTTFGAAALRVGNLFAAGFMGLSLWATGLAGALPILLGIVVALWGVIDRAFHYTAWFDGTNLSISYGLADLRRQTIPVHRVHGVRVIQPWAWRLTGWWRVECSVAGYGQGDKEKPTQILPVGSYEQACHVARILAKFGPDEDFSVADPRGATAPTYVSPKRAIWASPLDRDQQAVTLTGGRAITHEGRFHREVKIVELSHIQELTVKRGPLNQAWDLATVRFDLVPGPVSMAGHNLSTEDAFELTDLLRKRELPAL